MSNERNIRLTVSYDGTDFSGWQRQGGNENRVIANRPIVYRPIANRTVQGDIEAALAKIHKHPVPLIGSGRTDAGVHAAGQAANFYTDIERMEAFRFIPALNSLLKRDIRILDARETIADFHARFDAKIRVYRYFFIAGRSAAAHELRYALQLWRVPSLDTLNAYCRSLLGERDCSLFARAQEKSLSKTRYISRCSFFFESNYLVFEIGANAFLWKMVRSIAGTLLDLEEKKIPPDTFTAMLNSSGCENAGATLPPQGLFLWNIEFYRG
ncbi:tRNA pseudouridine synthase A [Spirochaetia bacterium]|nr:tRNA pseudouridine synthase A [Spirochaetia bacterium]